MSKIKVIVVFGGESTEHEVSILSAKNVIAALDKNKYDVVPVGITKTGLWVSGPNLFQIAQNANPYSQIPANLPKTSLDSMESNQQTVVFPVLHGPNGEDGTIQGLLTLSHLPFVGADVLGSAIGMDKDVQKRLLRDAKIPTAKFVVTSSHQPLVTSPFGFPVFVKPANAGSSIGVCKVKSKKFLKSAIENALKFDKKVLIEEAIVGREIEISVLGNEDPIASLPGEIIPTGHEFYDYDAKYIDEHGAILEIPAKLTKKQVADCQRLAIKTYKVLGCSGMARVDMFLSKKGFLINEINTIPGFTKISMYPKLWEASGLPYSKLLDKLIELALKRHHI